MSKTLRFLTAVTTSGLLAATISVTPVIAAPADDAALVKQTIAQMQRREGVNRSDMQRFTETLMRAYQLGQPGDLFTSHSPQSVAPLVRLYGEPELAAALSQWDLSSTDESEGSVSPASPPGHAATPTNSSISGMARNDASTSYEPVSSNSNRSTPSTAGASDNDFVMQTIRRMQSREPLPQEDVDRFERIIKAGRAEDAIARHGPSTIAALARTYGLNALSRTLDSREQVAAGSRSAADRLGAVTSAPMHTGDYRDEYLAEANSYDVVGVSRYEGALLTVFSEDLEPYTLDDPIAGAQIRNNVTSCLYRGSAPRKASPRASNTMQLLELPGTITAERFVPATHPEEPDVTEKYHVTKVALDWAEASASRVTPYFFGYRMPPPRIVYDNYGREQRIQPPPPPPEWHSFSCSPRVIRSN